ncbi:transmembrane GTPase Fzo1, putative [Talaromyces stipitatus ATCC 10500]|uniref:Transmembrane GTPase Fzo1, putative n=1 Tax=Talaromyces stipitatus (strain ATCC 10500 / CBS 375.48 / QM 6759 / NRRL 1006) TaxID=441959 RepID=B8LYE7_TALSN|nr:transmembrane GTPase Fzo1, putative [Talaromyces stipitatus ATCC 10500]EED22876.1 transmembrane GTPase Fzo1, putative [Talaromyces stipitatus ATCC 10500]
MSQEYFPVAGSSSSKNASSSLEEDDERIQPTSWAAPQYMTVGNGTTSAAAEALIASLNHDSGYGGSIAGESALERGDLTDWHAGMLEDRPTPAHTPALATEGRQMLASHVHQLQYNANRMKLGRAITRTIEILKDLQEMNGRWPLHYPSYQPLDRPSLQQTQSHADLGTLEDQESSSSRPTPIRRAATSLDASESSAAGERRSLPEPRLMSREMAEQFLVLKIELKLGAASQTELVHSLEKSTIASLLDGKINQSVKHLLSLRDRIEDTSSKVLITGDLNAGKSTFCNALLRRKILPEDQQPCTSIFCEVLDTRENGGVEEVHAIPKDRIYNRNDESTYDVFSLSELEDIVTDNSKYTQCKVYVKDVRAIDESLLNNGVVDIALIDAPGLNSDSVKTTAIFARQEEIDVVVFVVSAANHFTLSARDFIMSAAHEKAYMFMVVNGFDNIRDKGRCQRMILDQIAKLSPHTYKDAEELVHFVSSNAIPVLPGVVAGSGSGGSGDPPDNDDPDDDDDSKKGKGKGKEKEKIQDFEKLEGALRRFVLERRARSKLAPARTYILNVLSDLNTLALVNRDVAQSELVRVSSELEEIVPAFEDGKKKKTEIAEQVENTIEKSCEDVYNYTRQNLNDTIEKVAYADLGVEYPGLLSAFQFAEDLKVAMLDQVSAAVFDCENYARAKTAQGVSYIQQLGLLHVGEDKFPTLSFQADNMFRKRRHALARQVDTQVELWDFFDIPGLWERQEKVAGTGVAMTAVTVLGGRAIAGVGWVDGAFGAAKILGSNNIRRMIIPGIVATAILTTAYVLSIIPQTLPPRLSRKLAASLAEVDYVHSNASRISAQVRRVLGIPASTLHSQLVQGVEDLARRKEEVTKIKQESEVARKYFANLFRESQESRRTVDQIDLEGPLPGALAQ